MFLTFGREHLHRGRRWPRLLQTQWQPRLSCVRLGLARPREAKLTAYTHSHSLRTECSFAGEHVIARQGVVCVVRILMPDAKLLKLAERGEI